MSDAIEKNLPKLFRRLMDLGCIDESHIEKTVDGFFAEKLSLSDMLSKTGTKALLSKDGKEIPCNLFYDDWYVFCVPDGEESACGLFKMREQEYDAKMNREADGDTPGVTVSFISLNEKILTDCISDKSAENRKNLADEINRVVSKRGQNHSPAFKKYFSDPNSKGPYLIAKLYTDFIASLAKEGFISVPEKYLEDYSKKGENGRIARFVKENNESAGKTVCDNEKIFIENPAAPTENERLAILATHCGNTSVFSFAAEIQFHALFLSGWAKIPVPILGKNVYESAVRADMSIGDTEFAGPTPYYKNDSAIVRKQLALHKTDFL